MHTVGAAGHAALFALSAVSIAMAALLETGGGAVAVWAVLVVCVLVSLVLLAAMARAGTRAVGFVGTIVLYFASTVALAAAVDLAHARPGRYARGALLGAGMQLIALSVAHFVYHIQGKR